jgi:hypothetical protein
VSREEILVQVKEAFGMVPGYLANAPDHVLAQWWAEMGWMQSETALSPRDKLLVGYGASAAIHCEY